MLSRHVICVLIHYTQIVADSAAKGGDAPPGIRVIDYRNVGGVTVFGWATKFLQKGLCRYRPATNKSDCPKASTLLPSFTDEAFLESQGECTFS